MRLYVEVNIHSTLLFLPKEKRVSEIKSMSSDSSEDENINCLREAVDPSFINDGMFDTRKSSKLFGICSHIHIIVN